MARALRITFPGAFYHVTSRGNERKAVFKSKRDREKFLEYLESASQRYDALIHAYCMMANHYHLLLETPSGNLSQIMRHINGAYTTYFHVKRDRSGHLFQGRYKAILVDIDEYAKELSRYIHLNPVRAKIVETPEEYDWSSHKYYIGKQKPVKWLYRDFILGYFGKKVSTAQKGYQKFVNARTHQEYDSPLEEVVSSTLLGSADFIAFIKDNFLSAKKPDKELPALKELVIKTSIQDIFEEVELVFTKDKVMARNVKMYLCQRNTGKKLKEIGLHFGIGESGVSQACRRVAQKIEKDKKLKKKIVRLEKQINLSRMNT
jgi:REP element-mobilizing transposase RayT/predicted XRE-type DNA-binding protein